MANHVKGEATFKIANNEFTLCYNHEALVQLEDQLDRGIIGIFNELQRWSKEPDRIRLKWVRAILYAGLHKHHPNMTLIDVGDLIGTSNMMEALDSIGEAMQRAFSDPETKDTRPTTNGADKSGIGTDTSPNI